MNTIASLIIIMVAVLAIMKRMEVRSTLLLAGLALGVLAGQADAVVQKFFEMLTREQFVVPIGCSMGFAYVLRHTECDRHLVLLLVRPLRRARILLIPGMVLVAAAVNVPVVSQMSTAVLVGTVMVPVLRAASLSPVTIGAALLLGSSIGGEFLNPGSPELRTVSEAVGVRSMECVAHAAPLLAVHLTVALAVFWWLSFRTERRGPDFQRLAQFGSPDLPRIDYVKAAIPVLPVLLLFLTALPPPLRAFHIPPQWLIHVPAGMDLTPAQQASFDSRLIGAAMMVGVILAALASPRRASGTGKAFFEGFGHAYFHILSIIVAAVCFGEGVERSGLATYLQNAIRSAPGMLMPAAVIFPSSFAWLCGSGMAATQSLFAFYLPPAAEIGRDPLQLGAVVSLAAAAGRTMSPVAAVVLMSASLTGADPFHLIKRVAIPLLAGLAAVLAVVILQG
jgi:DcuC family C4-dicarboxylate transporter